MAAKRPPNSIEQLPNGATVEFWDSVGTDGLPQQRRYRVDGERLPSISTVAGSFDKPALMPAAVKKQEQAIIDLAASGVDIGKISQPELRSKLRERGTHYDDQWGIARKRGDVAHDVLLRRFIRDGEVPDLSDFGPDQRAWIQAGMKFMLDHRPEPLAIEYMVASLEHGFAGRADLAAMVGERLTAVDLKTVTEWHYKKDRDGDPTDQLLAPYDENLTALAGYEIARVESGYLATDRQWIVRLGPDGEYDIHESTAPPELFLSALTAYTLKGHVGKAVREGVTA
jgi:hypothetical protein